MGATDGLAKEVKGFGVLLLVIIVYSIMLTTMKDISGVDSDLNSSIETAKDAIRSPVTWFSIIVLLVVIRWVMKYLGSKNGM